jgi:hypothetical protein
MKFLQIHTFYEPCIRDFMQRRPGLEQMSHGQIMHALLEDAYSACHIIAPHLPHTKFDARLLMANFEPAQRAWARERGLEGLKLPQILEAQIEEFQPDVIYASDPVTFDSRFFRRLAWQPKLLMGWRAAPTPEAADWSDFDLILSNHAPSLELAARLGARATDRFEPGLPMNIAGAVADEPEGCDVIFSGQWSPDHTRRNSHLLAAARACEAASPPHSIEFHLMTQDPASLPALIARHRHPPRFGLEMHRLFKRGRICLNATIDIAQGM